MSTLEKIQPLFQSVLKDPSLTVDENSSAASVPNWDSMNYVLILHEIEATFSIRFQLPELRELKNVGDLVRLIDRKRRPS